MNRTDAVPLLEQTDLRFTSQLLKDDAGVIVLGLPVGLIASGKYWWTALNIFIQNFSIESNLQTMGMIIYDVLFECGKIEPGPRSNKPEVLKLPNETITLH